MIRVNFYQPQNEFKYKNNNSKISFKANQAELANSIAHSTFRKIGSNRHGNLGSYYGTTPNGTNITLDEISLAKKVMMYIQRTFKNKSSFDIYEINKPNNNEVNILSKNGRKIKSIKTLEKLNSYLNDIK